MDDYQDERPLEDTERQRFESQAITETGQRLELMARVLNKHRQLARLNHEIDELTRERDKAQRDFYALCDESNPGAAPVRAS